MADNLFKIDRGIAYANLASAPSNPVNGDTYYDSTLNRFRKYESGSWSDWTGTGGGLASIAPGSVITADYTVVALDNGRVLNVNTSSISIAIQLPAPSAGFKLTIKDYTGNAATNFITIRRNGSELISNTSSDDQIKINFRAYSLVSDGTNWFRVASFDGLAPETAGRGIFMGGQNTSSVNVNTIDYVDIATAANATNFGNLTVARWQIGAGASSTRAVFGGGGNPSGALNEIDYVTIATTGNAIDFGDLTVARFGLAGCSSSTRALFMGGGAGSVDYNIIDYVTIATTGNAIDFGDLTIFGMYYAAGLASPTRGVRGGGIADSIDYVTIATTGNAIDFGDLTVARFGLAGCSNATRGLFSGGNGPVNTIDYITIATTGNAIDFGDLTVTRYFPAACSSSLRGVIAGGSTGLAAGTGVTSIDFVAIATLSNATNFGNLTVARNAVSGCSNSHGGL